MARPTCCDPMYRLFTTRMKGCPFAINANTSRKPSNNNWFGFITFKNCNSISLEIIINFQRILFRMTSNNRSVSGNLARNICNDWSLSWNLLVERRPRDFRMTSNDWSISCSLARWKNITWLDKYSIQIKFHFLTQFQENDIQHWLTNCTLLSGREVWMNTICVFKTPYHKVIDDFQRRQQILHCLFMVVRDLPSLMKSKRWMDSRDVNDTRSNLLLLLVVSILLTILNGWKPGWMSQLLTPIG